MTAWRDWNLTPVAAASTAVLMLRALGVALIIGVVYGVGNDLLFGAPHPVFSGAIFGTGMGAFFLARWLWERWSATRPES